MEEERGALNLRSKEKEEEREKKEDGAGRIANFFVGHSLKERPQGIHTHLYDNNKYHFGDIFSVRQCI